jgi:hypothetical protein
MRGKSGRTTALLLWAAFAVVTWNVVFDRHVYIAAVHFTQAQIQRYERGERVSSIREAFTPELGRAAIRASAWGGAVFATGVALTQWAARRVRNS